MRTTNKLKKMTIKEEREGERRSPPDKREEEINRGQNDISLLWRIRRGERIDEPAAEMI
jgi:hypothetical protein